MMKTPAIQREIVAHLRALGRPETSRALAQRFLRIERGDEETCRRLLTPFLASVPGIEHRPDEGWSLTKSAPRAPGAAPAAGIEDGAATGPVPAPRPAGATGLRDFVRSEEHTSELQSQSNLVCRLLLEKKKETRGRRSHTP